MSQVPKILLNDGKEIPVFGLGTWKSQPGEVTQAVKDAIDAGYRHIDGAHIYQNETEVGAGIRAKIDEGVVKREELFVVSKEANEESPSQSQDEELQESNMVRSTIIFNKGITPNELAALARLNAASRAAKKPLATVATQQQQNQAPKIKLNNGQEIPVLGLGTWRSKPGDVTQAVMDAIDTGYRHFDCAYNYMNEAEVGIGLKAKLDEGIVKRSDLFITSKLWNTFHRPDLVESAFKNTLKDLQLKYLDLFLIHWPTGFTFQEGERYPRDTSGNLMLSDVDFVDTWKAMEKLVEKGLVKSIGVSNFNSEQLERLMSNTNIKPVVNQIEVHPYFSQKKLVDFCKSKDIAVTAYSSLRSQDRLWDNEPSILKDPKLVEISYKYNKSVAQVILRWVMQRGLIVIPRSVNKERISENLNILDFYLTDEDMAVINSLNRNRRAMIFDVAKDHKEYPFNIEF